MRARLLGLLLIVASILGLVGMRMLLARAAVRVRILLDDNNTAGLDDVLAALEPAPEN